MTIGYTQLYPTLEREAMVATTDYAQDAKVSAYQWLESRTIPPVANRYLRKISWWRGGGWELFEEATKRWTALEVGDWLVSERLGWRRVHPDAFPAQWSPVEPRVEETPAFSPREYLVELETLALTVLKILDPHPYAVLGYTPDGTGLALVTLEGLWVLELPQPTVDYEARVAHMTAQVIDAWEAATGKPRSADDA